MALAHAVLACGGEPHGETREVQAGLAVAAHGFVSYSILQRTDTTMYMCGIEAVSPSSNHEYSTSARRTRQWPMSELQ